MAEEKAVGYCCDRPNCNGVIQSVDFLDGTYFEFCTVCDYAKLERGEAEVIESKAYHRHFPKRFTRRHLVSTKHRAKEGEFQSFEEWKKTNPMFKDINLTVPESNTRIIQTKNPIKELLEEYQQ